MSFEKNGKEKAKFLSVCTEKRKQWSNLKTEVICYKYGNQKYIKYIKFFLSCPVKQMQIKFDKCNSFLKKYISYLFFYM